MLKKTITYTDFNGAEKTEDFYFNLTKAELIKMEVSAQGNSLTERLNFIVQSNNGKEIMDTFESIISQAYGERSADGTKFIKSPELSAGFLQTEAYSELFMEMVTSPQAGADFINGLVPDKLVKQVQQDTAAMTARQRSEASMQGYKKPEPAKPKNFETVPEIPTFQPDLAPEPINVVTEGPAPVPETSSPVESVAPLPPKPEGFTDEQWDRAVQAMRG